MPCWYYDKRDLKTTPSILDGIDFETENRYRKEGARFIIDTGTKMDLGCNTMATGVVYFHRFYMFHSFRSFPRYVTACCCLFLAGKVEETPKKCKDIIKTARSLLTDQKFLQFGDDPKEEVMTLERILLQTIKFDLQVEHPYNYLLKYAKCLKGDKNRLQKMVQMAWTFVNDSLCTTLCLQWEPEVIAVALIYLAGKLSKFEATDWVGRTPRHLRWWDMVLEGVTMDLLEDICHQVLDLYSQPQTDPTADSPPPPPAPHPSVGGGIQGVSLVGVTPSVLTTNSTSTSSSNTPGPLPTTPKASTAIPLIRESAQPIKAVSPASSGVPVKLAKVKDSKKHSQKVQSDLAEMPVAITQLDSKGPTTLSSSSVAMETLATQGAPPPHFTGAPPPKFHHTSSPPTSSFTVPPPMNFSAPPPNMTVTQGTSVGGGSGSNGHHPGAPPFSQFAPPFPLNQPPPAFYSHNVPPPRTFYPPPGSS
ncbi:cyclin-K isoform X1 [Hetaerina americana]|uniref:cyclin-K isoform X1 n=2 Tax=Hetaerina americana TaxID=62018 RepID=UPI003A7F3322